ncbi:MAG: hypothetical protein ACI9P5_004210 [Saprospiraceae bacterium]|jgi:hypothetical protein
MFQPLLLIITILLCTQLSAQIDDFTPEGDWQDFSFSPLPDGNYLVKATDTSGKNIFYALNNQQPGNTVDTQLDLLIIDTTYTTVSYIGDDIMGMSDMYYFLAIDQNDKSHILIIDFNTGIVSEIPSEGNWRSFNEEHLMCDGTLYLSLRDNDSNLLYRALISPDTVIVFDFCDAVISDSNRDEPYCRIYDFCEDTSAAVFFLTYYDTDIGYVKTSIPAFDTEVLGNNPDDSIHVLITNSADTIESKIYRVVDTTFNEIQVPGGPYDIITTLYYNKETNTSLFSLLDYNGELRLVKRINGVWTNLTAQLQLPSLLSISSLSTFDNEVYLEVQSTVSDCKLYNFQSYQAGDTLIDATPMGGTYASITMPKEEINYPMTVQFGGIQGVTLYSYYYGLSALTATPYTLENPNGLPAKNVIFKGQNTYTFTFYNIDSSLSYDQLYHRIAPGEAFNLVSTKDTVWNFNICVTGDEIVFEENYYSSSSNFYHYDFSQVNKIDIPAISSELSYRLTAEDSICLIWETYGSETGDSITRIFATNQGAEFVVDITHPRYGLDADFDAWNYRGSMLSIFHNRNQDNDAKLWLVTPELRQSNDYNSDFKFFNDMIISPSIETLTASEHYIGGYIPRFMTSGTPRIDFEASTSIELTPGAEISSGVNVTLEIKDRTTDGN